MLVDSEETYGYNLKAKGFLALLCPSLGAFGVEVHVYFNKHFTFLIILFWRIKSISFSRPFYRYGGHIELIRFKEYYRMPRGHGHISFVFSSAYRDIFSLSFLRITL